MRCDEATMTPTSTDEDETFLVELEKSQIRLNCRKHRQWYIVMFLKLITLPFTKLTQVGNKNAFWRFSTDFCVFRVF